MEDAKRFSDNNNPYGLEHAKHINVKFNDELLLLGAKNEIVEEKSDDCDDEDKDDQGELKKLQKALRFN